MSLTDEERRVMVELEIERADKIMQQVPLFVDNCLWDTLANRLYYAAYHAVMALLINSGIHVGTHKGAIIMFNKEFVRKGVFTAEEGYLFSNMERLRESGDYNCFIDTCETEIVPYIEPVSKLINKIKEIVL